MIKYFSAALLSVCFLAVMAVRADDVRKELFKAEDKLTKDDANDSVFKKSFQKVHMVKLGADQLVRIEIASKDFNPYLRLENSAGKVLAVAKQSHVVFKPQATETYRLVVTSSQEEKTGDYVVTVLEGILVDQRDGLSAVAARLPNLNGEARVEFLAELRGYLTKRSGKIDVEDVKLTELTCKALERVSYDFAAVTLGECLDLLAKTQDKKAQSQIQAFESKNRKLRLFGKNLTFKGTTFDGKEFDVQSLKGKVVLVDFWATWCGPCRAELPNVIKNYEKYKDQGFEVVSISLDANRKDLEKFMEKEAFPWTSLHEKDGKRNPTATMVGVTAIPTCILLDRNGKVVSLQARGPYLGQLLEKHVGSK